MSTRYVNFLNTSRTKRLHKTWLNSQLHRNFKYSMTDWLNIIAFLLLTQNIIKCKFLSLNKSLTISCVLNDSCRKCGICSRVIIRASIIERHSDIESERWLWGIKTNRIWHTTITCVRARCVVVAVPYILTQANDASTSIVAFMHQQCILITFAYKASQ